MNNPFRIEIFFRPLYGAAVSLQPLPPPLPFNPVRRNQHLDLLTLLGPTPARVSDLATDLDCSEIKVMALVAMIRDRLRIRVVVEHFRVSIHSRDWPLARTLAQDYLEPEPTGQGS